MTVNEKFVRDLVARFPVLNPLFEEHMEDNDEVLPHLFFWDLTQWLDARPVNDGTLIQVLAQFDEAYALGAAELRNLLDVSFLENLPSRSSLFAELGPVLATRSRELGRG